MVRRQSVAFVDGPARSARTWLFTGLVALAAGCSDGSVAGSTGETSPGVQPSGVGGSGGSGGEGPAGAAGQSGSSGHTGAIGQPASGPVCAAGKLAYKGTVAGAPVSFGAASQGGLTSTASSWWLARYAPPSQLYAFGPGAITEQPLLASDEVFLQGGWEGSSDAWYCAPAGAFSGSKSGQIPLDYTFSLPTIRQLGTCPGTPVEGSLTGCASSSKGDTSCGSSGLVGSLDGVAIDSGASGAVSYTKDTPGALFLFDEQRSVLGVATFEGKTTGFVLRHDPVSDRRTLYCLGDGTTFSHEGTLTRVHVPSLSRLGTCGEAAATAGSLSGCM